ncbi:hypothetical protein AYK26_04040 [Euryarchaeota archaeon SM23-78]|nr:MAG: hypothetical protein AYK26_04040 [Euryarchaeota archaeon SM23-78]MBW3000953.1 hypothetical protein [Candidatus Woesearchaeota archaeon]
MKLRKKILPFLLAGGLALGSSSLLYGADKKVETESKETKTAETIESKLEENETARELKIMRTELTGAKSFGDSDGFNVKGFVRIMDKPHTKFFLHGSYEDFDINLDKTEMIGGQEKRFSQDQNLRIGRVNPEFYVRTKGEGSFLTLTAGYEGLIVKSKAQGEITYASDITSIDKTEDGHAHIFYFKPGVKIGGDKWVYVEGVVRKVDSHLDDVAGQGPQELFAGTDNSPLILGGRININDLLTFDALNVDPKEGPSSQIYVASLNNYFRTGEGRINNKLMVEFLNKYFDNEQQWRFTEMFKYETPGGKLFALEASYKTDGDIRAQVLIPLAKNFQLGVGAQRDQYKGFENNKNDRIDAMLRIIF